MFLQTERLLLREFTVYDWRPTFEYQVAPEYLRYNPWTLRSEEAVRDFVGMFIAWSREQPRRRFQLAIVLRSEDRLIGNCGIRVSTSNSWEAELGYELNHHYWRRGYATEAARALVDFGFEELRLHRIYAHCIAENTGSARVLERIGMRYEGRFRESQWMKGQWWDTLHFAILDRDRG